MRILIVIILLVPSLVYIQQQQAYAATYKDPLGRFTIGYRDGWTPIVNSTKNSTSVFFREKSMTHAFSVMILPKTPLGLGFTTIGMQSVMLRSGYWISQPSFKLNLDGHETNKILVSGTLQPEKQKFESLILISEIGNHTVMSTYLSKTPETFMQEINDTATPIVQSFHLLKSS